MDDTIILQLEHHIDRNSEETEKNIIRRINVLEKCLIKLLDKNNNTLDNKINKHNKDDSETNDNEDDNANDDEDQDVDEDEDDKGINNCDKDEEAEEVEGDDETSKQSISEKFKLPELVGEKNVDGITDLNMVKTNILDVVFRVDEMEKKMRIVASKLNDLIKVNNAILRRLVDGAQYSQFSKKNKMVKIDKMV